MTNDQAFQVRQHGQAVLVLLGGVLAAALTHQAARELGRLVRDTAERALLAPGSEVAARSVRSGRFRVSVRSDGDELLIVFEPARLLVRWPHSEFGKIFGALVAQASRAEEWAEAERVARDHAILLRAGSPIGLTSNPVIQAEAKKIAEDDRDLRRWMPGGVRAKAMTSTPIIRHETRSTFELAKEAASRMPLDEQTKLVKELSR